MILYRKVSAGNKIVIAEHLEDNLRFYKVKAKRFLCMVKKTIQVLGLGVHNDGERSHQWPNYS